MKIHYSWVIVVGCVCILFSGIGLASNSFSVFLEPLSQKLHISKTEGSSLISVINFTGAFTILFSVVLYNKFSVRKVSFIAGLSISLGYGLLIFANHYIVAVVSAALLGVGYGAFSLTAVSILVSRWFVHKKGLALGIAASGTGVATFLFPPMLTKVILAHGLEAALLIQCLTTCGFAIIALILIRDYPADKKSEPYISTTEKLEEEGKASEEDLGKQSSYKEVITSKEFLCIAIGCFLIGMTLVPTLGHVSPILTSLGFDPVFAAMMISIYGIVMIGSKVLTGFIIDKTGTFKGNMITGVFWTIAMILPFFISSNSMVAIIFAVFIGLGGPIGSIFVPLWILDLIPKESYAKAVSLCQGIFVLGGSLGGIIPGIIFDITGSYLPTFYVFTAVFIFSMGMIQYRYWIKKKFK